MKQQYAEVIIRQEPAGWQLENCSNDFLEMTGFSREELKERFQDHFVLMLSAADMPAADELFSLRDGRKPLCPWIFELACAQKESSLPVLEWLH